MVPMNFYESYVEGGIHQPLAKELVSNSNMKLVWYCIQSELNTSLFCHHGRCSGCSRGDHAPWLSLSILTIIRN
ncbi:hypothetical protein Ahy_B02g058007 isoform B [Arachis hypogaea]|uniref:Uncharacterized protein n=1 Tax=Arachis hypogaea TaxID=3818 RepID=A0A445ADL1_ARAHY|nr:hypothetical protein Ahy_B02g058007 isoform B [Arachis hypogaea]